MKEPIDEVGQIYAALRGEAGQIDAAFERAGEELLDIIRGALGPQTFAGAFIRRDLARLGEHLGVVDHASILLALAAADAPRPLREGPQWVKDAGGHQLRVPPVEYYNLATQNQFRDWLRREALEGNLGFFRALGLPDHYDRAFVELRPEHVDDDADDPRLVHLLGHLPKLSARDQEILQLSLVQGLLDADVATHLRMRPSALRVARYRLIARLRRSL